MEEEGQEKVEANSNVSQITQQPIYDTNTKELNLV